MTPIRIPEPEPVEAKTCMMFPPTSRPANHRLHLGRRHVDIAEEAFGQGNRTFCTRIFCRQYCSPRLPSLTSDELQKTVDTPAFESALARCWILCDRQENFLTDIIV